MHDLNSPSTLAPTSSRYGRPSRMRATRVAMLLVIGLGGCTNEPGTDAPGTIAGDAQLVKSGSRIRAVVGSTSDGSSELVGWYDADLDTDCAFRPMEDGQTRCLPSGPKVKSAEYFSDAACRSPVVNFLQCDGSTPRFVVHSYTISKSGCTSEVANAHEVGQPATGAVYQWSSGRGCTLFAASDTRIVTRPIEAARLATRTLLRSAP